LKLRKRIVAFGSILLLVVTLLVWAWKQERSIEHDKAFASGIDRSSRSDGLNAVANSSVSDTSKTAPLPPLDMPVAATFNDLQKRADRGDAHASCRLAVELINCKQLESLAQVGYMQNSESTEKSLTESGLLMAANSVATQQIRQLESMKRCDGTSEEQRKPAGTYLLQAASAGIPEAMIRYAEGQSIMNGSSMFGLLQDTGFDQWRSNAVGLLEKALRHGEPAAVFVLYVAYSDNNSPIGGLIPDDPVKAYSYRLLMNRLRGKSDTPASKLSPQQIEEAVLNATRMHAEYFHNRIVRESDAFSSLLTPDWARPEGTAPRRPCE
jgi:hypothetical protein